MKYCPHCGAEIADDVRFCPTCGKEIDPPVVVVEPDPQFDAQDIADNRMLAMLGYLTCGILPMIGCRNSAFAMHHVNQAPWIFIGSIVVSVAMGVLAFTVIVPVLGVACLIALFVFEIMGIVPALKGSGKYLPFVKKLPVIIK